MYTSPILLTQQFRFCGNSFRADTYKGCDFGCKYCFANYRFSFKGFESDKADMAIFEKYITKKGTGLTQELINNNIPIHLGGMSDPFQSIEKKEKCTLKFLEMFKNYPVSISTKTNYLNDEYFTYLNPKFHTFQISLMSDNEETIKKFEDNTPSAKERISFIKELKKRGFWVSVRVQPMVDVSEAISLLKKLDCIIDYATIEHMKVSKTGNIKERKELFKLLGLNAGYYVIRRNYYKLPKQMIENNIRQIKSEIKTKIGCGDNEIHELSDSKNCCGIDCMPESFNNWLKYNSMYIMMTNDKSGFCPENKLFNCNVPPNTFKRFKGNNSYKFYVDKYLEEVHKFGFSSLFSNGY